MSSDNEEESHSSVRKRVSIVWKYFEKLSKDRVRCRLCRHEQNYQGTTGNILRHLRNKHNVDATIRGQQQNPEQIIKLQEQLEEVESGNGGKEAYRIQDSFGSFVKLDSLPKKPKLDSSDDSSDIDPYTESTINFLEFHTNENNYLTTEKQPPTLEEQRILAEIEYFKEKAAYYRMQKNLVALQAKKIKYELDEIG